MLGFVVHHETTIKNKIILNKDSLHLYDCLNVSYSFNPLMPNDSHNSPSKDNTQDIGLLHFGVQSMYWKMNTIILKEVIGYLTMNNMIIST